MKFIDLTIPLGIATPPWPTYEPLQLKYFKRLAPNGANGQLLTHSPITWARTWTAKSTSTHRARTSPHWTWTSWCTRRPSWT